jgi:hypothetical protein
VKLTPLQFICRALISPGNALKIGHVVTRSADGRDKSNKLSSRMTGAIASDAKKSRRALSPLWPNDSFPFMNRQKERNMSGFAML